MNSNEQFNEAGRTLMEKLLLRFPPIAFKMIYHEAEVPEGSVRPLRDTGRHPALCQAFAMVRRNRAALPMFKEDNWCIWPNACFKLCPLDEDDVNYLGRMLFRRTAKEPYIFKEKFPCFDDKTPGLFNGALDTSFYPDVVMSTAVSQYAP
jgi:uncharacterized protein (DUF169 family)